MNFKVIKQLYKKEILDVLRDKKTIIMMVIVPLLIYPLMFVGGMVMMSKVTTQMDTQTYEIAVDFMDTNPELVEMFLHPDDDTLHFKLCDLNVMDADISMILRGEKINAIVYENEDGTGYNIAYLSSVTNSSYAEQKVRQVLSAYSDSLTNQSLEAAGLDPDTVLHPFEVEDDDRASTEETTGSLLGVIVPFMLVVSLLMGTMYPAIDTTAGERERGTLETILTLPVTNQELIFSKFLTVGTIGVASALLNVLSMGGIGVYLYKLAAQTTSMVSKIQVSKFVPAILVCCLCILAFAVLISALSMCFCVFAKTYKEANNYITPLMLLVMFASFIGFMPNVTLTRNMALVPVANICLLIRDLLAFKFSFSAITIVLFSNVAYGIIAVLVLGKLYNSEAILFGDGTGNVQIFERRSNMIKGGVPSVGDVCLVLPVVLVLMIYAGGFASAKSMLVGLLVTQGIVGGVPLLTVYKEEYSKDISYPALSSGISAWRTCADDGNDSGRYAPDEYHKHVVPGECGEYDRIYGSDLFIWIWRLPAADRAASGGVRGAFVPGISAIFAGAYDEETGGNPDGCDRVRTVSYESGADTDDSTDWYGTLLCGSAVGEFASRHAHAFFQQCIVRDSWILSETNCAYPADFFREWCAGSGVDCRRSRVVCARRIYNKTLEK